MSKLDIRKAKKIQEFLFFLVVLNDFTKLPRGDIIAFAAILNALNGVSSFESFLFFLLIRTLL